MDELITELELIADGQTIWEDSDGNHLSDVIVDDYAGGNVDDAYWTGGQDGRIELAREILGKLRALK